MNVITIQQDIGSGTTSLHLSGLSTIFSEQTYKRLGCKLPHVSTSAYVTHFPLKEKIYRGVLKSGQSDSVSEECHPGSCPSSKQPNSIAYNSPRWLMFTRDTLGRRALRLALNSSFMDSVNHWPCHLQNAVVTLKKKNIRNLETGQIVWLVISSTFKCKIWAVVCSLTG